jgi:hypothetical protein
MREIGDVTEATVLDLRKVRSLPIQVLPDLPFTKMKGLNLNGMDNLQLRGQFLDGLSELPPFHIKQLPTH